MARGSAAGTVLDEPAVHLTGNPPVVPPSPSGDLPPSSPAPQREPFISNARLGMLMFLTFEGMFFGGLLGAFLVFRLASIHWPPPGQPYLPGVITWINTAILLSSGYTMRQAVRAIRQGNQSGLLNGLGATALLGTIFLAVQGTEWIRLVRYGLTLSSGTYASTFYTLIGCHAVHVLGALVWLLIVLGQGLGGRFAAREHVGVQLCSMYWYFVVGLWPVLFGLVYLY